jgi:peptidoglycan/LPS O-acetylase OafA/YrhL
MTGIAERTATPLSGERRDAFRPDLQGLRAIAVVLVLLYHAGVPWLGGGYIGVDVFFVLSGFLITSHLTRELAATGRIGLVAFWTRRAKRLLPAALVVVLLTVLATVLLEPPLRLAGVLRDAAAAVVYLPNLLFAVQQTDYLAETVPSPLLHYWSLGVEEQFYLLWPLLLIGLSAIMPRRLWAGIAAVAVLSFTACLLLQQWWQPIAFFSLPTRAWELAAGGLVAVTLPRLARLAPAVRAGAAWAGLALIVACALLFTPQTAYPGPATALPVLGAAAMVAFGATASGPARLLSPRPVQWLGLISYSVYLVHWPLIVIAADRVGLDRELPLAVGLLLAALSIPLGWLLYRWVETPMRRLPAPSGRVMALTVGGSVAIAALLLGGGAVASAVPISSGRVAESAPLGRLPGGTAYVPSNMTPTLSDAAADTGSLYTDGCQQNKTDAELIVCSFGDPDSDTTVVLFGDSHAGRWFPALEEVADQAGVRLQTMTKSGCRSEDVDVAWQTPTNPSCAAWRGAALAALSAGPPDLILLANHLGPETDTTTVVGEAEWAQGFASSRGRLPAASTVVSVADSPHFPSSPVLCLAANVDDANACAVDRGAAFNEAVVAARAASGPYVDLSDWFCNAKSCPAVIGSTLAFSDEHHMTATFSRELAPALGAALKPYLTADQR